MFKLLPLASLEASLSDALSYFKNYHLLSRWKWHVRTDKGDISFFFVNTVHSYRSQIVYYKVLLSIYTHAQHVSLCETAFVNVVLYFDCDISLRKVVGRRADVMCSIC